MSDGPILQLITSRGPKLQLTQMCENGGQTTIKNLSHELLYKSPPIFKSVT